MTVTLNPQELALIGNALAAMPYSQVKALIENLQSQINEFEKSQKKEPLHGVEN